MEIHSVLKWNWA